MHNDYDDITSRIAEPPKWWDENGVPRYCEFHPNAVPDIYCDEAVLFGVTCQGCETRFKVALSRHRAMAEVMAKRNDYEPRTLAQQIQDKTLHYGDPPNTRCCPAGPTMNSEPRIVLEYWCKDKWEWVRDKSLEVSIEPDWVTE